MYNQTRLIKLGKMSKEHLTAIIKAGVDIPNDGNIQEKYQHNLQVIAENTPVKGDPLYTWIIIESRKYNTSGLKIWQMKLWQEYVGLEFLKTFGSENQAWIARFEAYKKDLADRNYWNGRAFKWFNSQVLQFQSERLFAWKVEMLLETGLPLAVIDTKKAASGCGKNAHAWKVNYEQYKAFLIATGRKPRIKRSAEEKNLRSWEYAEINALRRGGRTDKEAEMLAQIGITG